MGRRTFSYVREPILKVSTFPNYGTPNETGLYMARALFDGFDFAQSIGAESSVARSWHFFERSFDDGVLPVAIERTFDADDTAHIATIERCLGTGELTLFSRVARRQLGAHEAAMRLVAFSTEVTVQSSVEIQANLTELEGLLIEAER